jgi:hypothetical protein
MRNSESTVDIGKGVDRRSVVQGALTGIGGLATAQLLGAVVTPADAAPADPGAGPIVTPEPIKEPIQKSGLTVELVDFIRAPQTSASRAYARLNFLYHAGDGSGRLFACDTRGYLYSTDDGNTSLQLFLDVRQARGGNWFGSQFFMGLRSFAFHPDFAQAGQPGFGKFYTATTERPSGAAPFSGPYPAHHDDVIAEWSVDPANPRQANPSSRRELLRIAQVSYAHNTDQLMFNPNLRPGDPGYGMMFFGVGDGGNFPTNPDPYNQAQNPGLAPGKIFCIDPLPQGTRPYGIPGDNPFVGRPGHLPEIWAMGVRHPQNLCFDRGGSGAFIIADIGQAHIEEINLGVKGANYGWPLREGTFVSDRTNPRTLYALPADDSTKGFTYPVAQYDHSEGFAVTGGFVYRGTAVPALVGHYLFGDIKNGRIFHIPVTWSWADRLLSASSL